MGLLFEDASNQSKYQKILVNAFFFILVSDQINNFLLHLSWLSMIFVCSYFVFIILFIKEVIRRNHNKDKN
ncbi:hypothetical protein JOC86_003722 [Bacillus pakistanensis]|uniref:Uncharacterized protein n=1 Tax=Rossellomorea pakistanensis TaxID=992288 RepID=A0ABS2NHA7_9BACI|nr:hypothetical protein [Bacillus pakistanensis]